MVCGLEIGIDQRDFTASGRDWSVFIHFHYPQKEISLYCVQRIDNKNFLLFSFKSLENFRRALELMHRSTGLPVDQQQPVPTPVQPPALMDLQIAPPQQLEFKELVSQKCSERNILFAPMPGRRESGKQVGLRIKHFFLLLLLLSVWQFWLIFLFFVQVYRVGKIFCYIDRSVVMISDGSFNNWTPVSLQTLLERAISGNIF